MNGLKKAGKFLCSMKCAIGLLLILVAACTAGSLIPQREVAAYYAGAYSEPVANLIMGLGLDDIFHCWWFVGLTVFLCVNLLFCNLIRFPSLIKRTRGGFTAEKRLAEWDGTALVTMEDEPGKLFEGMGFRKISKTRREDGAEVWYSVRHKLGIWGAWLCHLGMLIVIIGFGMGQLLQEEYVVYGVPGQTKPVGDLGYELRIDSFEVKLREDATVEQYTTEMTVWDTKGGADTAQSGKASVNSPLSLFGMKFYQNSTGWAADLEVWKDGEVIQKDLLCAGEYALIEDREGLAVMLNAFYPDYGTDALGMPMTLSPRPDNPAYLYTLYYHDKVLGMNVLSGQEKITVDEYTLVFTRPQQYTLIQVKKDPFTGLTALGGLLVLLSLLLAFYVRPEELWALKEEGGAWAVAGKSPKSGGIFLEAIVEKGQGLTKEKEA